MKISKISKANSEIICRHKSVLELGANYQPETLYYILKKNPQLVNKKDNKSETFLSYAIKRKNEEITKLIINFPILDLSYQDSNGNTYLHLSIMQQLIPTTILLLKKGIKINSQNNEGNTALHYAYNFNNKQLISILKEYKADLNIENKMGIIPEKIEINSLNININSSFDEQFYKSHNNFFDKNLSIQLNNNYNHTNHTNNNTNTTKLNDTNKNSSFKYSLVNFSYSEDEDEDIQDNKENSDIFNLSNSDTYKKKVKNVININSQTVGEGYNIILDNNNNKNNKSKNDNGFFENSTSISKEEKELQIQKSFNQNKNENNSLNNEENVYNNYNSNNKSSLYNKTSYKYLEQDFIFSPFDTLKEALNNDQKNGDINNQFNLNDINPDDSLYKFLSEINLEKKYYILMNSNGFEDIDLLVEQERNCKLNTSITNSALKEIGIYLPGDRAKILIHLEEKAGNYSFAIPKNVYYFLEDISNINNDENIKKIFEWLKVIKVENYLDNFIKCGYFSLELILMQMNSKNPINDDIIKDELGIKKVGHRARIINKLVEDGKIFWNKMKEKTINIGSGQMDKNCDCNIF